MGVDTGHPQYAGIRAAFRGIRTCCSHTTMGKRGHPHSFPLVSVHPHLLFPYNYWQARASALIPSFFRGIRTCCFHATIGKRGHPRSFPLVSVHPHLLFPYNYGQARASALIPSFFVASALVVSIQLLASAGIRAHSLLFLLIRTCCFHTTIAYSVHPHGIRSRLAFQHHSTTMASAAGLHHKTL